MIIKIVYDDYSVNASGYDDLYLFREGLIRFTFVRSKENSLELNISSDEKIVEIDNCNYEVTAALVSITKNNNYFDCLFKCKDLYFFYTTDFEINLGCKIKGIFQFGVVGSTPNTDDIFDINVFCYKVLDVQYFKVKSFSKKNYFYELENESKKKVNSTEDISIQMSYEYTFVVTLEISEENKEYFKNLLIEEYEYELDINKKNFEGKTKLDRAMENNENFSIEYLRKYGAKRSSEL